MISFLAKLCGRKQKEDSVKSDPRLEQKMRLKIIGHNSRYASKNSKGLAGDEVGRMVYNIVAKKRLKQPKEFREPQQFTFGY